ncbi:MAG: stage 0 sporulation protein [Spirochaetota bacterium]|jgi:cell fate regulator YaaT (PSP1 superfamily)|nr:stage 0 sporulation protein [Spirochaetota bacterium]
MLVCKALLLDNQETIAVELEEEQTIVCGDFVYLDHTPADNSQTKRIAQVVSESLRDETPGSAGHARIHDKAAAEDLSRLGWDLSCPVRILYNAELAFIRPKSTGFFPGMKVVVTSEHGNEIGQILRRPKAIKIGETLENEIPLIRIASPEDLSLSKRNEDYSEYAWKICLEKIEKHNLPMNLVKAHVLLEGNKVLFFFTSEGRVDFRALAKDLASVFHTRIELRQIGVRDRSQLVGGCGVCGLMLCCRSCKAMVQSVTIKMAKKQNLALNSSKISGVCGKLLCCLSYEYGDTDETEIPQPEVDSEPSQ